MVAVRTSFNEFFDHGLAFLVLDDESLVALLEYEAGLVGQLVGLGLQLALAVLLAPHVVLHAQGVEVAQDLFHFIVPGMFMLVLFVYYSYIR